MNDLDEYIVAPIYFRVVKRRGTQWHFIKGESFYNPLNLPRLSLDDLFVSFGTNMYQVSNELRKINGGEEGFYLVDIMDKRYYYCGTKPESVRGKLIDLGIGKKDLL